MIPDRFVTEYPERCLALLDAMEPIAREKDLLGSFALLTAASILNIPLERLSKHHPINMELGSSLYQALRAVEKQEWAVAQFWQGNESGQWHFARIVTDPNHVIGWQDDEGRPSMSEIANTIRKRKAGLVLRVLRNALAHGNIVYLNEDGYETAGTRLHFIGFLSRYEEGEDQRAAAESYRLLAVSEGDFLSFIRRWASWLASFPGDFDLVEAA
jgi:hypothetical protein